MKHFCVVGLGYGDEGKGTITDYLTNTMGATLNVRFNGGAQAGHNVVTDDGRHHTFSQFGSGTFHGAKTLLSRFIIVNPISLLIESGYLHAKGIDSPLSNVFIDERALIVTPYHGALNRIREMSRGGGRHGSCGKGIGECVQDSIDRPNDVIRARDINSALLGEKLETTRRLLREKAEALHCNDGQQNDFEIFGINILTMAHVLRECLDFGTKIIDHTQVCDLIRVNNKCIFEGAQGILIDEQFGDAPYNTWSNCTSENARTLFTEAGVTDFKTYGVIRTYMTRHGPGRFPTESAAFNHLPEPHNVTDKWQGQFRRGWMDVIRINYAIECDGHIDAIAMTHCDQMPIREAEHYLAKLIEIRSFGPKTSQKHV